MGTPIRELLVKLGVDADLDSVEAFEKGIENVTKAVGKLIAAAGVATAAVGALAYSTAAQGDAAAKSAARTGTTAEEYQRLAYAADKSAVSTEMLDVALTKQTSAVNKAIAEGRDYIEVTDGVRISVKNADGTLKSQTQIMEETADAIANASSEQEALAIAQAIYGEELGAKMLPLLKLGGEGIAGLGQQAEDLGLVLSNETAAASEVFNDSLTDLHAIATGLKNILGEALIPVLTAITEGIRDWYLANKEVIRQNLQVWADRLATAVEFLGIAFSRLDKIIQDTVGYGPILAGIAAAVTALGAAWVGAQIATIVSGVTAALSTLGVTFGTLVTTIAPVLAVAALVVASLGAIYLAVDDLLTYMRGGDSLIGRFIERFKESESIGGTVARLFEQLGATLGELFGVFEQLGIQLGLISEEASGPASSGFETMISVLVTLLEYAIIPLQFALEGFILLLKVWAAEFRFVADVVSFVGGLITSQIEVWKNSFDALMQVIDMVTGGIQGIGAAVSSLTGGAIDLGLGGGEGSEGFAPGANESAAAGGVAGGAGGVTNQTSNVTQTNNITINGGDPDEVRRVVEQVNEEQARSAAY